MNKKDKDRIPTLRAAASKKFINAKQLIYIKCKMTKWK
jgi:hypothetical protein